VWNLISFVNICHHKVMPWHFFLWTFASSSRLGAYNVMPFLWLTSTLISQCNAPQTFGLKRGPTFQSLVIRLYIILRVLIWVWHPTKPNHPKLCMDMHNILSTHDVIQICVKNEHATCNASIAKRF
jgi:hypothetical protein